MRKINSKETVTCFNCEGVPGFYFEFVRSGQNYEKMICPSCKKAAYTVPSEYMLAMPLIDFIKLLEIMERITPYRPLHDLKFTFLSLPNAILYSKRGA